MVVTDDSKMVNQFSLRKSRTLFTSLCFINRFDKPLKSC